MFISLLLIIYLISQLSFCCYYQCFKYSFFHSLAYLSIHSSTYFTTETSTYPISLTHITFIHPNTYSPINSHTHPPNSYHTHPPIRLFILTLIHPTHTHPPIHLSTPSFFHPPIQPPNHIRPFTRLVAHPSTHLPILSSPKYLSMHSSNPSRPTSGLHHISQASFVCICVCLSVSLTVYVCVCVAVRHVFVLTRIPV